MKRLFLAAALAALAATPAAALQRDPGAMFDRADGDGDGAITRPEYAAARRAMFDRLDRNGDGVVARDDLGRFARPRPQASERLQAFIALGDSNRDGRLTRQEFAASPMPLFDRADGNGDGVVDRAERDALRASMEARR